MKHVIAAFVLMLMSGCANEWVAVRGEIVSVRVVAETAAVQSGGDSGVVGALVGAVVAGPIGAIVGGLATRENAQLVVHGRIVDCRVFVRGNDGHEYASHITRRDNPSVCATIREGDATRIVMFRDFGVDIIRWYWGPGEMDWGLAERIR